jgi:hypothetical protein
VLSTVLLVSAEETQTAKVLAVKAYDRGRIAYWEGRVPIYDDYPFYDLTLALGEKKYVVRYESLTGYFPSRWKAGSEVKVRTRDKGRLYLTNGAEEVALEVVRSSECVLPSTPPATVTAGAQVPCE